MSGEGVIAAPPAAAGMGVTGNAQLLLGFIAGAIVDRLVLTYLVAAADPEAGSLTLEHARTGNTFRVTVTQIGGVE